MKLDIEALNKLDKRLDSLAEEGDPLWRLPRDVVFYHLLTKFELDNDAADSVPPPWRDLYNPTDGHHFALTWAYQWSKPPGEARRHRVSHDVLSMTERTHERAVRYAQVWDIMAKLFHSEWTVAEQEIDGRIVVTQPPRAIPDMEVADFYLNPTDRPELLDPSRLEKRVEELIKLANPDELAKCLLKFRFKPKAFAPFQETAAQTLAGIWEFDDTWDLGGYTAHQLRMFWEALIALVSIRDCVHAAGQGSILPKVPVAPREQWIQRFCSVTNLSQIIVGRILADLTSGSPGTSDHPKAEAASLPFCKLGGDLIALSYSIARLSNPTRNVWRTIARRRKGITDALNPLKEERQRSALIKTCQSLGLQCAGPFKFTWEGVPRNLDLLIWDETDRFMLACELKWFSAPDWSSEAIERENELEYGLEQAEIDLNWVKGFPSKSVCEKGSQAGWSRLSMRRIIAMCTHASVVSGRAS